MSSETGRITSILPDTPSMPEDVLDAVQLHQAAVEAPSAGGDTQLSTEDLTYQQFAEVARLAAAAAQASIAKHTAQPQSARVSDDPYHLRPDYEYSRLTFEQRENVAAMLAAGGRRDAARAMGWYSFRGQDMPRTWSERGRDLFSAGRELASTVGRRLGIIPVARTITAPPEVRTVRQATPYVPVQSSRTASYQPNLRPQPAYTPPRPQRPARAQDEFMAASVAAPVAVNQHHARPAPAPSVHYAERLVSSDKLAELRRTINTSPQPQQYKRMDLEAAAAFAPTVTPGGAESLAARTVRRLNEGHALVAPATRRLPAIALDRYGRIATEYQTAELPFLPANEAEHSDSKPSLPSFEDDLAEMDARNKRLIINEAIFHNFGQPTNRLRMPLPPSGVNKQHGRVANRALKYLRAIPEDSPESNLAAALQMAELFVQPEELLPLATNAMAIAGVTKAAKGAPLAQLAAAVANGLERAAQHRAQLSLENAHIHADEQPADLPISAAITPTPEESTVQYEGVDEALYAAAGGFMTLRALYYQHDQSARDWVKTPGFISGVDEALQHLDPSLYAAAKQYFSLRGVQMRHIISTALLGYDGPQDTAAFLPVLHRSLGNVLAESGAHTAAAN